MTYIVKQKVKGQDYYYLRKSVRIGSRVISQNLGYLGKDRKKAEKRAKEILKNMKSLKESKTENKEMEEIQEKKEVKLIHKKISIDDLAVFCNRKGFVYPSSEIYGGMAGFWDFGPFGAEMKNNLVQGWWNYHIRQREDMVGIDGSIITNPKVWEASGHVSSFVDVAVICKKCGNKFKVDKHELEKAKCDKCGGNVESKGEFNPMFTTQVGPVKEDSIKAYLRPETAQVMFADFKVVMENARMKLPFGIAQVGKAFRNEISPIEFLFRCREFEQMEIEYFISPDMKCPYMSEIKNVKIAIYSEEMQKKNKEPEVINIYDAWKNGVIRTDWHAYWMAKEVEWFVSLGANPEKFRVRQHHSEERSHYSSDTWDLEYNFPMGWRELQGFANRGNFDLSQHQKYSGVKMEITDEGKSFIPHVVCEPSLGVGRAFLVFMFDAYYYDESRENIVLRLNPKLAPIKAAIFPIVKQPEFEKIAKDIFDDLKKEFKVIYDKSGSVGRRYSRNDEIGTPYCITIDGDSPAKRDVTIRDRDTTKQIRVKIENLREVLRKLINQEIKFEEAGKLTETRKKNG